MSLSLWCQVDGGVDRPTLIGKGLTTAWRMREARGGRVQFATGRTFLHTPELSPGMHHIVVTADRVDGTWNMYVDGQPVDSAPYLDFDSNDRPLRIGGNPESNGKEFVGIIDDVAIWDRPLTEQEVLEIWDSGSGKAIGQLLPDPDGDSLPQYWEKAHGLSTVESNAQDDPDGDGSPNIDEFFNHQSTSC